MPTKEEREARNAAERARYESLPPEEREKILARTREWKAKRAAADPETHRAARTAQIARQQARMKTDPEYAEKIRKYQREAAAKRRAAKKASAA